MIQLKKKMCKTSTSSFQRYISNFCFIIYSSMINIVEVLRSITYCYKYITMGRSRWFLSPQFSNTFQIKESIELLKCRRWYDFDSNRKIQSQFDKSISFGTWLFVINFPRAFRLLESRNHDNSGFMRKSKHNSDRRSSIDRKFD